MIFTRPGSVSGTATVAVRAIATAAALAALLAAGPASVPASSVPASMPTAAGTDTRPTADVLAELKQLSQPSTAVPAAAGQSPADVARQRAQRRAELVKVLVARPDDAVASAYLTARWHNMQMAQAPGLEAEVDDAIGHTRSADVAEAAYVAKCNLTLFANHDSREHAYAALKPVADAYAARVPDGKYLAGLFLELASVAPDTTLEAQYLHRCVALAKTPHDAEPAVARLRTLGLVGKPLPLDFNDAASGRPVHLRDLVGKVVVLDFWATWCGPCVAQMPALKQLYAKYKDQGVEFIGVSLDLPEDQGGLAKLREFVKAKGIPWPQFYQGGSWDGEFSSSLGVMSVPTAFVIDRQGVVADVDAQGKLDSLIPAMLGHPHPTTNP